MNIGKICVTIIRTALGITSFNAHHKVPHPWSEIVKNTSQYRNFEPVFGRRAGKAFQIDILNSWIDLLEMIIFYLRCFYRCSDSYRSYFIRWENTLQFRQIFILSRQSFWGTPSQKVPLMNQQRSPALNSYAGHPNFRDFGHLVTVQQGFFCFPSSWALLTRNNSWRSACGGMDRHPCS